VAVAVAVLAAPLVAGCGSSSAGAVAVPTTQGLGVAQAAAALCNAGLRIQGSLYLPDSSAPEAIHAPGYEPSLAVRKGAKSHVAVLGTSPASGTRLAPGSAVTLRLAGDTSRLLVFVPSSRCALALSRPILSQSAAASMAAHAAGGAMTASGATGPVTISFVQTTRQAAVSLVEPGDLVDSNQPVALVLLRGSFVSPGGGPLGSHTTQTASVMTLSIDDSTRGVLDSGIQNSVPDLAALGPVQEVLTLPAGGAG